MTTSVTGRVSGPMPEQNDGDGGGVDECAHGLVNDCLGRQIGE